MLDFTIHHVDYNIGKVEVKEKAVRTIDSTQTVKVIKLKSAKRVS